MNLDPDPGVDQVMGSNIFIFFVEKSDLKNLLQSVKNCLRKEKIIT